MQDIHSLSGEGTPAAARLFSVAEAGDRHLGLHHHHNPSNQGLKCPRCDSLNTKFCYYNNYNLSQPRHFCKSCRRYWTKGGVLRNVPVGGGCRKSRRSSSSSKPPPPSPSAANPKPPLDDSAMNSASNNNHSSSDSSTLTATAPAEIPTLFQENGSTCVEKTTTVPATERLYGSLDITLNRTISSDVGMDDVSTNMLTETDNFTAEITPFGYAEMLTQQQQEMVIVDGFGPLDWQGRGDENNGADRGEGLFDMTVAVDHAYWSAADVDVDQQQGRGGLFRP